MGGNGLTPKDQDVLEALREYEALTAKQLAAFFGRSRRSVAKSTTRLRRWNLVESTSLDKPDLGRPEHVFWPADIRANRAGRPTRDDAFPLGNVKHRVLTNWIWVCLEHLAKAVPVFEVRCHSTVDLRQSTESTGKGDGRSRGRGRKRSSGEWDFIPDGVFTIGHRKLKKTLLFFLEAERGTQPGSSPSERSTLERKIHAYRECSRVARYKTYEKECPHPLDGFRLLILNETGSGLERTCRVVAARRFSGFVWLTDLDSLLANGIGADIWVRGGRTDEPRRSILGRAAPSKPVIPRME